MVFRFLVRRNYLKRSLLTLAVLCFLGYFAVNFTSLRGADIPVQHVLHVAKEEVHVVHKSPEPGPGKNVKQQDQACMLPTLTPDDPVMMKFFKEYPPTKCPQDQANWVYVENGTLRFSKEIEKKVGNFQCEAYPLRRDKNDNVINWDGPVKDIKDGSPVPADAFKVKCWTLTGPKKSFVEILYGVSQNKQIEERLKTTKPPANGLDGLSILCLGYDSMSRMAWIRRMKKTREFFLGSMNAIELQGYNIMGDGTPAALFPILTGRHEEEMYESRRHIKGAKPVDDYPWIWKDFQKKGYVTSWAEAAVDIAPFNYRLLGFHNQPTDYFMRPYYLGVRNVDNTEKKKHDPWCRGATSMHKLWLDWPRQIMDKYMTKPKFMFHFYAVLSHNDNNKITMGDEELRDFLVSLQKSGHLNHTVVVLFGDHGARYSNVRATYSGKLEERLPYMGISFPPWFYTKHEDLIKNLRTNAGRLTTPMDIHYTLLDFLRFDGAGSGDMNKRGISLFKKVPTERECSHADVRNHWCACMSWNSVPTQSNEILKAATASIQFINDLTSGYREDCAELSLLNVTSANKMASHKEMQTFVKSLGRDGRTPAFGEASRDTEVLYQLSFITTPGNGHFEITLSNKGSDYTIAERDISRINKYGLDPECILQRNRQLRQFCYCRSKIKVVKV